MLVLFEGRIADGGQGAFPPLSGIEPTNSAPEGGRRPSGAVRDMEIRSIFPSVRTPKVPFLQRFP
jgi:hypothetical protein